MFTMTEASGAKYNFCINGSYSMWEFLSLSVWCLGLSISNIPDISQKSNEEKVHSFLPFLSQAYQKGAPPKSRILPAGGKVLTSEDEYNLLSDRHFSDPIGELLSIPSQDKMPKHVLFGQTSDPQGWECGDFTLQGHLAVSGDIFGHHNLGGWCNRHLMNRGQ